MGSIFTAALFASNASILDVVLNNSSPTTILILTLGISSYFGFGAAITGFVLIVLDENSGENL